MGYRRFSFTYARFIGTLIGWKANTDGPSSPVAKSMNRARASVTPKNPGGTGFFGLGDRNQAAVRTGSA